MREDEVVDGPDLEEIFDVAPVSDELQNLLDETRTTEELAWEVLRGRHGRGEKRKESLGDRYSEVQKRVKEIRQNGI